MVHHARKNMVGLFLTATTLLVLAACGGPTTSPSPTVTRTSLPTNTPARTLTPTPTNTPTPVALVCNPADFPTGTGPVGTKQDGPPTTDFQYPPQTYHLSEGGAAGSHLYLVCSVGNAASILAFMQNSIPAGGWTILSTTATTISAQKPTSPPGGFCYTVDLTVGQYPAYSGEWTITFHSPAATCG